MVGSNISKKRAHSELFSENYLTSTDVVVGVITIVPVHVEPVVVPVTVEHIVIRIELLPDLVCFTDNLLQNYLRSLATQPDFFKRRTSSRSGT